MVNMTGSIATTATAVLAAGLGGGGGSGGVLDWTNGNNMTTTTASIMETATIFDSGQDYAIRLPLCLGFNSSSSLLKGGGTTSGGLGVAGNINSVYSESAAILGNAGIFGDNESELIYGTDMETAMMGIGVNVGGSIASGSAASGATNELTIEDVKYLTYGILWPTICGLGIIGNILNLIVLNQPNMKGTAYIYMRGYSSAALMAITVAIPFANRVLHNNEVGPWTNMYQAFFHTYLELYLGNSCLGIGVMMLVALTMERFVAVCHPEKSRALQGSRKAYIIIASIPICTFLTYSPHLFLSTLSQCVTEQGATMYQKRANLQFTTSISFIVYRWFLALVFRLIPTILLAYLNLRIIIAYRRTCARRRIMTGKTSRDENKKFAEESRIMLLLGSTSVLFFVCVTPMVILSVMISEKLLKSFSFQVFRATANLLEVTNYSLTFYIYCLFSREFRNTFLGLLRIGKQKGTPAGGANGATPTNKPSGGITGTNGKPSSDPAAIQQQGGSTPLL
ncbi:unnamed protein product [Orchesella dallaii]|uniref:G-protein coupled receptors family 1 profile domain-containing protein n=1 Tax=Orchesella dallaii TaxID=48710 RepID=A0ABP1QX09_9HEXA